MTTPQKRWVALVVTAVVLVAAVGFVIFLLTASDPAANLTRAGVGEAREPATQPAAADDVVIELTATPEGQSNIELGFTGSSAAGEQPGFFQAISGEAVLGADGSLKALRGTVDMASVLTNADRLTNNLKNEPGFFEVQRYPTASFFSTSVTPLPAGGEGGATHQVEGNLTVRDVTRSVSFPARVTVTPAELSLESEFSINRRDFGVNYEGGIAFPEIRDLVRVNLNITAARPAVTTGASPGEPDR